MERKIVLTGIIKYQDEYLIVKRSRNDDFLPGSWEFPGGNINDNELIYEALQREILEEIGFNIEGLSYKIVHYYDKIKDKKEKYHYIELDFLIEVANKDFDIVLSIEHDDYCWIKKDSLLIDDYIKSKIDNL